MRTPLIILALGLGLQGCGFKGPLVLPAPAAQTAPPAQPSPPPAQEIKK